MDSATEGSSVHRSLQEEAEWRREKGQETLEGKQLPHEVRRAGRRHEERKADAQVTASYFMGRTAGFFNTFTSDIWTQGSYCLPGTHCEGVARAQSTVVKASALWRETWVGLSQDRAVLGPWRP